MIFQMGFCSLRGAMEFFLVFLVHDLQEISFNFSFEMNLSQIFGSKSRIIIFQLNDFIPLNFLYRLKYFQLEMNLISDFEQPMVFSLVFLSILCLWSVIS